MQCTGIRGEPAPKQHEQRTRVLHARGGLRPEASSKAVATETCTKCSHAPLQSKTLHARCQDVVVVANHQASASLGGATRIHACKAKHNTHNSWLKNQQWTTTIHTSRYALNVMILERKNTFRLGPSGHEFVKHTPNGSTAAAHASSQ